MDFSTPDGKSRLRIREKDILNKLIGDRIVLFLAREAKVFVFRRRRGAKVDKAIQESRGSQENLESTFSFLWVESLGVSRRL